MDNSREVECCANCAYLMDFPKGNKYGDVEHFCLITGYYTHNIHKDRKTIKHFSPGGKELHCHYKNKDESV